MSKDVSPPNLIVTGILAFENSSRTCSKRVRRKEDIPNDLSNTENFSLSEELAFLPIGHQLIIEPL